ncbi:S-adenosyl-L-methionine-dependent methyltransferase [Ascodesmis nigricans]|uniref:S-adenosyl-L-methionine-dependent methyltransferase n=1 Tax=Ascodesmis nigricans TaxID=341454 RepID=A0A4S2MV95_9PEZI|nr:S-adenosyl-L-methionine-dependent methyltransferase [Ascodesmis nigricans]
MTNINVSTSPSSPGPSSPVGVKPSGSSAALSPSSNPLFDDDSEDTPGEHEHDPTSNELIQVGDDAYSDYASASDYSDNTSVTSSIRAYLFHNGRRYHRYGGQGKYVLPNDEAEQDRLDLHHHLALMVLDAKLHTVKLPENLHRVLDCGTGTGIWALEFGAMHPEAVVTGVDLSPIQPNWVETNVRFEVDDLEKEWTWRENHFQFIHSRNITNGIRDFGKYVSQMYKHTSPGGVVEISENLHDIHCQDGTINGTRLEEFWKQYKECSAKAGFRFPKKEDIENYLQEAGFEDVTAKIYVMPWGPWARDKRLRRIGHVLAAVAETGMEAYGLQLLTTFGDYTVEQARSLFVDAMKEMMTLKVHAYQYMVQVTGRKPTDAN